MEKRHIFSSFLTKILDMPLWVKEILYVELKKNVEEYSFLLDETGHIDKESLYQYYVPSLTYAGKKELTTHSEGHAENVYNFLECANEGLSAIEITISNYWALEEAASINVFCLEKQYVTPPSSLLAKTMLVYLSGKIRLGEYFKRLGKIDVVQLENALRRQKELEAQGQKVGIATIMINMGYITEEDSKLVLHIKDECKKRFVLNPELVDKHAMSVTHVEKNPVGISGQSLSIADSEVVLKLTKENASLKNKIESIGRILSGE